MKEENLPLADTPQIQKVSNKEEFWFESPSATSRQFHMDGYGMKHVVVRQKGGCHSSSISFSGQVF